MSSISMRSTRRTETPILNETLHVTQTVRKAKHSFLWGSLNATLLLVIVYDIVNKCPFYITYVHYVEIFAAFILGFNTIYHFFNYVWNICGVNPMVLTQNQKKLLGIRDSDPYFKVLLTPENKSMDSTHSLGSNLLTSTPLNLSTSGWRSLSPSPPCSDSVTSANYTMSSPSWMYFPGSSGSSPDVRRRKQPSPASANHSRQSGVSSGDVIEDEHSLTQYLQEFEAQEKKAVVGASVEQPSNLLSSFWSHSACRTPKELSPLLRRTTYQLAPSVTPQTCSSPGGPGDETGSPSSLYQSNEVWRRVKVNPVVLTQWNANLRMWISQTVLDRLVREIAFVDKSLQRHGLHHVQVGAIGLECLKKTAQTQQVAQNIPTLAGLIPFLELTPHQEYLVNRIKELAKGGSMSEFRWNSGGIHNGKNWEEPLPTDAAVVMHLLATYLDSQLLPILNNPEGRPFTSQHFVKKPDKPAAGKNALVIYQVTLNPPHYVLISGEDTLDVVKGHNNLFQTILLFLHQVNTKDHGMLGRVNLGPSGINILWVIDL